MKPVHVHEDAELHRELLSLACRSLDRRGRPDRASGSVSVRSGEAVIITTGDLNEESLQQDAVMVDPSQGLPLLGETDWPPPETPAHLALHRRLPGRGAVVHIHEPRSLALAAAVGGAPGAIGALVAVVSPEPRGPAPLAGLPGHPELPELPELPDEAVALLVEGRGVFTWGRDTDEALSRLERIEELGRPLLPEHPARAGAARVTVW
ncbi:class II aldolase/adducin family protein [Streptomyces sp. NPDC088180]|uniref:class II aldolase/adducin family protein n=1 Tax=Streptomyces sp. NPDC088180 TaxID=3365837 RepID=UPI003806DC49